MQIFHERSWCCYKGSFYNEIKVRTPVSNLPQKNEGKKNEKLATIVPCILQFRLLPISALLCVLFYINYLNSGSFPLYI
jgi:hypothetical protein